MQFPNCKQLSNLIWWPTWKTNYVRKAKSISRVFGWVGYLFIYLFFQVGGFGPCGITNKIAYFSSVNTWLPLSTIPHIECSNFGKFLGSEYAFLIFLHSLIFFSHERNWNKQKAEQFCQIQLMNYRIDQNTNFLSIRESSACASKDLNH